MASILVYSTETPPRPIKVSPLCPHGKDAGQTCYPCEYGEEIEAQWRDAEIGDAHYASFDA